MAAPLSSIPIGLNEAYSWLYKFEESHLRPAAKQLFEKMKINISSDDFRSGWATLKELHKFITQPLDDHEPVEILIHCGWAAFQMNNEAEAVDLLKEAFSRAATHKHQRAVASWMLGYILWLRPYPNMHAAIQAWENSIDNFDYLVRQRTLSSQVAKWYFDRWKEMGESLQQVIASNGINPNTSASSYRRYPGSQPFSSPFPPPASPPPTQPPTPGSPPPGTAGKTCAKHRILHFPVLGAIPAGSPANIARPMGALGFEEVILDDIGYRVVSFRRDESTINLPEGYEYYVLKVSGKSMNKASPEPILNDDYVLMRAQSVAESGDIVAAEIVGVDERATLKRYRIENGKIVLYPESDDPAFQDAMPMQRDAGDTFHIRGIALAVLKRIEN